MSRLPRTWLLAFTLLPLAPGPSQAEPAPPPQPVAFRIGFARFERPKDWFFSRPTDGLRAAQLEKKFPDTTLCITFTRFPPGAGGTVQANIERWQGQFLRLEASAEVDSQPLQKVTTVKMAGTMKGGVPGGPAQETTGVMLLGAILESPEDGLIMVKLAGPEVRVIREEAIFRKLVATATGQSP